MPPTHGMEKVIYYVGLVLYANPYAFLCGSAGLTFLLASYLARTHKGDTRYGHWQQWLFMACAFALSAVSKFTVPHTLAETVVKVIWAALLVSIIVFFVRYRRTARTGQ